MLRDALEPLVAEREIRQQLYAGCRALDRLDLSLFLSVLHEGGTWDDESLELIGPVAGLAGAVMGQLSTSQRHVHHLSNVEIQVDGDRAVSQCQVSAVRRSTWMVDSHYRAQYLDQWFRRDGRWAIDRRRVLGGLAWKQFIKEGGCGERSRRGRADPVYELFALLGNDRSGKVEGAAHDQHRP